METISAAVIESGVSVDTQYKKPMDILQLVQQRATEVIQGLVCLRGRRNCVCSAWSEVFNVHEYLMVSALYTYYIDRKKMEPDSSQWCPRTGGGGHKLEHEKFYIDTGKNFSYSKG